MKHVDSVYAHRFSDAESERKAIMWREIARFLQRYVPPQEAVVDIACDRGAFIRNIEARERWATDIRDVSEYLPAAIHFVRTDGLKISNALPHSYFGVAFMSNYLEHLPSNDAVIAQMRETRTILRTGGRVIVLQPNIRLVGGRYWDFIDHRVPLTEKSLVEAAELTGFRPVDMITRFLPYTTKSRFPQTQRLLWLYLKMRPAWFVLGKQTLLVAEKL
jgi:SAM-dependent methyltransferase